MLVIILRVAGLNQEISLYPTSITAPYVGLRSLVRNLHNKHHTLLIKDVTQKKNYNFSN